MEPYTESKRFLSNLFDLDPPRMVGVLDMLARGYRKPPMATPRILDALALVEFCELVRGQLSSGE